jgi:hypothetical protein
MIHCVLLGVESVFFSFEISPQPTCLNLTIKRRSAFSTLSFSYDISSTAMPNCLLRGSTRTTRASHWTVAFSKLRESWIVSPIAYARSVSKKNLDRFFYVICLLNPLLRLKGLSRIARRLNRDAVVSSEPTTR